jgi:hypothetical protein
MLVALSRFKIANGMRCLLLAVTNSPDNTAVAAGCRGRRPWPLRWANGDVPPLTLYDTPQLLRKRYEEVIDDRRFAEAIYRVALASGSNEPRTTSRHRAPEPRRSGNHKWGGCQGPSTSLRAGLPPPREGPRSAIPLTPGPRGVRLGGGGWVAPLRATYAIRGVINGGTIRCPRK